MSKEEFNARLEGLIGKARELLVAGFGDLEPEETTKAILLEPLFEALGYRRITNFGREFKISLRFGGLPAEVRPPAHVR